MRVRKNARYLSDQEKQDFVEALLILKNTPYPGAPVAQPITIYDYFVSLHLAVSNIVLTADPLGTRLDYGHTGAAFFAWHRQYLLDFEDQLDLVKPGVTIPYWDWTPASNAVVFADDLLGPNGGGGAGGNVASGYFAYDAPATSPFPWPTGLAGWRVRRSIGVSLSNATNASDPNIALLPATAALRRFQGGPGSGALATLSQVRTALNLSNFNTAGAATGFHQRVESTLHGNGHVWFGTGAHMRNFYVSPNDPTFWLHHCNIDRLWAMWQVDGHWGSGSYPAAGESLGHNLPDEMWPWGFAVGSFEIDFSWVADWPADLPIPDHSSSPVRRPADVVNHRELGYCYDTEAILGVALDRSWSMTGPTPDPATGAGNITKWEAAKQAVVHLLQDCEAAYDNKEAYLTGGVLTFTTNAGGNTFTPVFPGTPYGLIKPADPTYSGSGFTAALGALGPEGNTPLAGALTETENQLVRAPFTTSAGAGDETRYLSIITDGKEYPPGPLATLPAGGYSNTKIFGMGFGIGSGWDGVDEGTIDTLVEKGMPPSPTTPQAFFGGSLDALDKFFRRTIATAIGYEPVVDPRYELTAGQHVDTQFFATSADDSFFISAVGYDFDDGNWHHDLIGPDGTVHHGTTESPVTIRYHRGNGKTTIFLHRDHAERAQWVGAWTLRSMYMPKGHAHHESMLVPNLWELALPSGSPPIRGPIYSRFKWKAAERPAVRLLTRRAIAGLAGHAGHEPAPHPTKACTLSVNVFGKGRFQASLSVEGKPRFAGRDFDVILRLKGFDPADFRDVQIVGRLLAPKHSIGSAYLDRKTIPVDKRIAFLKKVRVGELSEAFDELEFLAEYERHVPGAFPLRDEAIVFAPQPDGTFRARVTGNRYPGVYRVGVYVDGAVKSGAGFEPFVRVVETELALGIRLDEKRSRPLLHWRLGRLVVSFTPTDRLGNVPSPARVSAPVLYLNGVPLRGKHINAFTCEHHIEVPLGEDLTVSDDGTRIAEGSLKLAAAGHAATLEKGSPLRVTLSLGGMMIPVSVPAMVGDRRSRKTFAVGSKEALALELDDRELFVSVDEARGADYEVTHNAHHD